MRNCCIIDGRYYVVPQSVGAPEIGAVVALGDTKEEAIEECRNIAEQVEGHYVSVYSDCLDQALEELDKLDSLTG